VICTLFIHEHIFTFKPLCLHSITKILRNGPRAHFPFTAAVVAAAGGALGGDHPWVVVAAAGTMVVVVMVAAGPMVVVAED
jgi:hypothetical protein